jgi:tetratricopeptide (TPR) repeat protein/predicted aspartyl protease
MRTLSAGIAIAVLCLSTPPLPALADCKLLELARLPVTMKGLTPLVEAKVNGADALFVADSGAFYSFISPASAAQFKLKLYPAPFRLDVVGVGGEVDIDSTMVNEFALAGLTIRHVEFLVGGSDPAEGAAGVLGQNVLRAADVEYDLANGVIRLMQPTDGCRKAELAYWAGSTPYSVIDIEPTSARSPHTKAEAEINGVSIRVMFDTGAASSILGRRAARRAGVRTDGPGVVPAGEVYGAGRRTLETWIAPFASFKIGGEVIRNTKLRIGDVDSQDEDMLVGADFFLSHRVYVSNRQRKLYFTYNGGPVFDLGRAPSANTPPPEGSKEPADAEGYGRRGAARAARRDFERAIADLTRAIELSPGEARYYYQRARMRWNAGQGAEAIADLDEAFRLKPDDFDVLMARARFHLSSGDAIAAGADLDAADRVAPQGTSARLQIAHAYVNADRLVSAVAQYDRWIADHARDGELPVALNGRCWARALLGVDLDKALADCDAALKLRGDDAEVLDSRALVRLRLGDFGRSLADYDAALSRNPGSAWSLYGRGLAKLRKGMTEEARADIAAAIAARPTIAEEAAKRGLAP